MPGTKTALDSRHAQELLNEGLKLFRLYGNPSHTPTTAELQKIFSPNLRINSNDRNLCTNLNDFVKRIQKIQQETSSITYSNLQEAPLVSGNKAVLRYGAELNRKSGKKAQLQIMAIATFEDDKIVDWVEVVHEKGTGSFDLN